MKNLFELFSANEFSALVHNNMAPSQDIVSITPPLEEPLATLSAPSSQISVALSKVDFQSSTPLLSPRLVASPLLNNFRPPPVIKLLVVLRAVISLIKIWMAGLDILKVSI